MRRSLFLVVPSLRIEDREHSDKSSLWNSCQMPIGVLSIISYCRARLDSKAEFYVEDLRETYYQCDNDAEARSATHGKIVSLIETYQPDYIFLSALFNSCSFHFGYIQQAIVDSETKAYVIAGGGMPLHYGILF